MKNLTRVQLHKWIWSCPVTRIAEELRISGSALAKKCRAHNIPTPGRGYWRKIEQGIPVVILPLPNPDQGFTAVPVKVSEERAAELDQLPAPSFGNLATPTVSGNLSGGLAVQEVLAIQASPIPTTNDFVNSTSSAQIGLAEHQGKTFAPANIAELAILYGQAEVQRRFFEALKAAGQECDAPTKAVLMLWSTAARALLLHPEPIAQVVEECRSIASGGGNPEWWISMQ